MSKVLAPVRWIFGWPSQGYDASRETAWLDGVRGVAAFLVMMSHYSMEWLTPFSDAPFGATAIDDKNPDQVWFREKGDRFWEIWRLPILRVFMTSGNAQVAVFFVLSGFVLSWGPLATVRTGDYEKLGRSLGSSTIRRWFRLYVPCAIVSTCYLFSQIIESYHGVVPALQEVWKYIYSTERWANPFEVSHISQFQANHPFNYVMWTIPFEFGGSIFIYVTLLGLGRVRSYPRRMTAVLLVSMYAFLSSYWGYWLFGFGLAIADYVRQAGGFKKLSSQTTTNSRLAWIATFIVGLLMLGYPPPSDTWFTSPGYEWMARVPVPENWRNFVGPGRFWWGWGGIFTIMSASHLKMIRNFFELSFIQHLGRISFMLYLIHILVDLVLSKPLRHLIYDRFCEKEFREVFHGEVYITTPWMNFLVHVILLVTTVPLAMIIAHFLEVYVDRPCTKLAKWVDEKLVNGIESPKAVMVQQENEEAERLLYSAPNAEYEMGEVRPS